MPSRMPRSVRRLLLILVLSSVAAQAQTPPDPPRGDFRFVVFGDFNGPYGALEYPPAVPRALEAMATVWRPDLLLSPGDLVAGQSHSLPDERFPAMWEAFDAEVASRLRAAAIPYAAAMGNHDASSLRSPNGEFVFARDRRAASEYWSQPMYEENHAYVDRERFPYDYAFRSGRAFIVVLDASSAFVTGAQRAWLERTLALPVSVAADLRVVVGHLPLAPVAHGRDGPGEVVAGATELRRIFEANDVGLYVSGHHAAYYPGRLGRLELLFAGGVGGRRLLVGEQPARSTLTLVDVWWEPLELRYTTFDLSDMEIVSPASLPPSLAEGEDAVRISERAYPAPFETAQERAR